MLWKLLEGRSEVVTGSKRASGLKGAEVLRRTSLVAWLGSMQPKVCAEIKRLLSIFLHPQLVCCQTWFWAGLLQLFPWLLRQRMKFMDILWQYVLLLHRKGINCLQSDVLVRWQWICHPFLFCHSGLTFSCWCSGMTTWSQMVFSDVCSDCYLRKRRFVGFVVFSFLWRLTTSFSSSLLFWFPITAVNLLS